MKSSNLITALLFASLGSLAQDLNDDIIVMQNMYGIEKRKLVSDYMKIPEAQATDFWSLYDKYEIDRRELGKERVLLITQFADNYTTLTDEKADEIATGLLANTLKFDKLHQAYYNKIKKNTSPLTAAKFMQLEIYLQSQIRSEIQETIPFIGEIEQLQIKK
jgi:hypothetical protein